jgi:hypothetical protein
MYINTSLFSGDPMEFAHVILHFLAADELVQIHAVGRHADSQAVGLCHAIDVIRRDQPARSGHILHDHFGITGQMFGHISRQQTRPAIVKAA